MRECVSECVNDIKCKSRKIHINKDFIINVLCVLTVFFVVWLNGKYLFQVCRVYGDSMHPTYYNSDTLLVNKFDKTFDHNDIIVFNCQNDIFIKRVVGVPGDKVQIIDGFLYVNDAVCETVDGNTISYMGIASEPIVLGTDEYFVLGDNHENSMDSRYPEVGPINTKNIIGRVIMKLM